MLYPGIAGLVTSSWANSEQLETGADRVRKVNSLSFLPPKVCTEVQFLCTPCPEMSGGRAGVPT